MVRSTFKLTLSFSTRLAMPADHRVWYDQAVWRDRRADRVNRSHSALHATAGTRRLQDLTLLCTFYFALAGEAGTRVPRAPTILGRKSHATAEVQQVDGTTVGTYASCRPRESLI